MPVTNKRPMRRRPTNQPVDEPEAEDIQEEEVAKPARVARRVKAQVEPDVTDEEVEVKEAKARLRSRPSSRVATKPADNGAEDISGEEPKAEETRLPVSAIIDDLGRLLDHMAVGNTLILKRVNETTWKASLTTEEKVTQGRRKVSGTSYWNEVLSDEFKAHQATWEKLSPEEKVAKAKKEGVVWDEHDEARINIMRLSDAYRQHHGIEKYKPMYSGPNGRAMREALKGK